MSEKLVLVFFTAITIVAITACDESSSSESYSPEDNAEIEAFELSYEQAICERAARCEPVSQQACEGYIDLSADSLWLESKIDLSQDRILFDSEAGAACLEVLRTLPCGSRLGEGLRNENCEAMFAGTLAGGAPCWTDESCLSGECADQCGNGCCQGTCTSSALPDVGEACDYYSLEKTCATGSYCALGPNDEGICKSQVGEGASCDLYQANPCAEGLVCKETAGELGLCSPPPAIGSACEGTDCGAEAYCSAAQVCTAIGGQGDPCDLYISNACQDGLICHEGSCRSRLQAGETCSESDDQCDSAEQLRCLDGLCTPMPSAGDACSVEDFDFCDSSSVCINGICVDRPTEGEACDAAQALYCVTGLQCREGRCAVPSPASPCSR